MNRSESDCSLNTDKVIGFEISIFITFEPVAGIPNQSSTTGNIKTDPVSIVHILSFVEEFVFQITNIRLVVVEFCHADLEFLSNNFTSGCNCFKPRSLFFLPVFFYLSGADKNHPVSNTSNIAQPSINAVKSIDIRAFW